MLIILSSKIDTEPTYEDKLFSVYHYPKKYRNQIHEGDVFIYYQGNRYDKDQRYYFGAGRVKSISCPDGENYYAELIYGIKFDKTVPIYLPDGGYVEQLGFKTVRNKINPPWQQSIRPISNEAFSYILYAGIGREAAKKYIVDYGYELISEITCNSDIESENACDYIVYKEGTKIQIFTTRYERKASLRRQAILFHGTKCMACGFNFSDVYGEIGKDYIEVHHIKPLASINEEIDVNPDTDLVVVCSNCHRMIHRKKNEVLSISELRAIISQEKANTGT